MAGGAGPDVAARARANRRGILWMCAAMAFFIVNDALVKHVSERVPTAQLIFVRGLMAAVLVLAVAQRMGATRAWPRWPAAGSRSAR